MKIVSLLSPSRTFLYFVLVVLSLFSLKESLKDSYQDIKSISYQEISEPFVQKDSVAKFIKKPLHFQEKAVGHLRQGTRGVLFGKTFFSFHAKQKFTHFLERCKSNNPLIGCPGKKRYAKFLVLDCSYYFLRLSILKSQAHPPTYC